MFQLGGYDPGPLVAPSASSYLPFGGSLFGQQPQQQQQLFPPMNQPPPPIGQSPFGPPSQLPIGVPPVNPPIAPGFIQKPTALPEPVQGGGLDIAAPGGMFLAPRRPNYGVEGRPILLKANHFQVRIPTGVIQHYEINIVPDKCPRRVNREIVNVMVRAYQQQIFQSVRPVYDGKKNLYTRDPLPIGRDRDVSNSETYSSSSTAQQAQVTPSTTTTSPIASPIVKIDAYENLIGPIFGGSFAATVGVGLVYGIFQIFRKPAKPQQ